MSSFPDKFGVGRRWRPKVSSKHNLELNESSDKLPMTEKDRVKSGKPSSGRIRSNLDAERVAIAELQQRIKRSVTKNTKGQKTL
ncbi:MAG: hypothetical protein JWM99_5131 [Verrucomicrobiales bacterium]|nr:hypothetical protein [Verrucomicrobiales bacterium]